MTNPNPTPYHLTIDYSQRLYVLFYTWHQYQTTAERTGRIEFAIVAYFRKLHILYSAYESGHFGYCYSHNHYFFGAHCPWSQRLRE